jgi:hypothetical protein
MEPANMPISLGKAALAALFAIPCAGCMSQNAMSLVPDSVRLEIAQQKAAKAPPVSVGQMLQKARANAAPKSAEQSKALDAEAKVDLKPTGEISASNAAPLPASGSPKPLPAQKAALQTKSNDRREQMPPERRNAVELFEEARSLQRRSQPDELDFGGDAPSATGYGQKSQGGADAWRKMLAQVHEGPEDNVQLTSPNGNNATDKDVSITTSSLPDRPESASETIPVKFDIGLTGLAKDDDLKIRLLRHGNRLPETIVIGRIDGAKGFQAMQRALDLGKIIARASGGNPGISYDPALLARTAELHYMKPGTAQ